MPIKRMGPLPMLMYANAFILGFALMGFEMVASRYMYPFFGGSIETWAAIISTVLLSLMTGYFTGGIIADRFHTVGIIGWPITLAAFYIGIIPLMGESGFHAIAAAVPSTFCALMISALIMLWVPVTLIGMFTPCSIRLILLSAEEAGKVSGRIYGISTFGNVVGTLMTTFYLIPHLGSTNITFLFSILIFASGMSFFAFSPRPNPILALGIITAIALGAFTKQGAYADSTAGTFPMSLQWSGGRAMNMIATQLSFGTRAVGTPGHQKTIDFITASLAGSHALVRKQQWNYRAPDGTMHAMTNIIAQFDPANPRRMITGTHYDSIIRAYRDAKNPNAIMPGANNSASGVAVLLETARLLTANPPAIGIDMVFFDGEEGPHSLGEGDSDWTAIGSSHFAMHINDIYPGRKPEQSVILDMVCYKHLILYPEPFSKRSAPRQVDEFWKIGSHIAPAIFLHHSISPILDDHSALAAIGIPSFLVIGFDYAPWFNTTQDTIDKCSPSTLEAVGRTLLAYVRKS